MATLGLGNFIKKRREELGLSQRALEKLSCIPGGTIPMIETGRSKNHLFKTLHKLSVALDVPFETIIDLAVSDFLLRKGEE